MELVVVVGGEHLLDETVQAGDGPLVQRQQLVGLHQPVGVEAHQIVQTELAGVAELQVVLAQLLEDLVGAAHVHMVVGGAGPQTQQVGAVLLEDLGGIHTVAQRLVHGLALAVHRPAVGDALSERGAAAQRAHGHQQGGLEPAAVLVKTLDIHGGGPEVLVALHGGEVGGAGVEPAVQRVRLLLKAGGLAAVGAGEALGQDIGGVHIEPCVGALLLKQAGHGLDALLGADGLAAVLAVEHGDGQAPAALAADAPVGALQNHGAHAILAPGGHPAHVLAGGDGLILEGVHGAEPLGGGAEDDGLLAAPAVGVAVDDVLAGEQGAVVLHVLQDHGVGRIGGHALVLAGVGGVFALIVHGHHHVHAVALAGDIVVGAEAGGGVDAAGTGVHGDVIRQHQTGGLGQEGVVSQHVFKEAAGVRLHQLIAVEAADPHDLLGQRLGHDIHLAVGGLYHGVALVGVQGDGQVAGQRPDGGGPDQEVQLAVIQMGQLAQIIVHGELDVDGGAGIVLVLDLRFGQRRLVVGAPVHGLETLVDVAVAVHAAENANLLGFKAGVHGLVGVLPVAHHAHTLEALALDVDIVVGKLVAGGAEVRHAHGLVVQLVLLDDGGLDGHAVVVPAGDIGGVVAPHGVHTGDEVLQGLVKGVAHVQRAVGERRAVVEVEQGLALVLLQQLVVEVELLPVLEHVRLALGQARPHGKAALGHIQCLLVLHVASPLSEFFDDKIKAPLPPKRQRRVKASSAVPLSLPRVRPLSPTSCGHGEITARRRPRLPARRGHQADARE